MGLTALAQRAGFESAYLGEYRGATTAARFSDPATELEALHAGCGVYDLGYRAKISLTGGDRVRWLNGMVTNNVRDLAVGHGVYAFLLNPQGHILGDLYAYNRGESILVDGDAAQIEKILATFDHYIIMDDVEVKNLSEELTAVGIGGPQTREVLQRAKMEIPELQPLQFETVQCACECGCVECTVVRGDDPGMESYEIWLASAQVKPLWDALGKAGATAVGYEAIELQRIVSGIPRYGVDIRERDLPQETEQARALNFSKGCYVGQEIVERIRSRGAVHRKFTGLVCESAVAAGSRIVAGEKEVGEITSAATVKIAGQERHLALGYMRREAGTPGREVKIGEVRAVVATLPFADAGLRREAKSLEERTA